MGREMPSVPSQTLSRDHKPQKGAGARQILCTEFLLLAGFVGSVGWLFGNLC